MRDRRLRDCGERVVVGECAQVFEQPLDVLGRLAERRRRARVEAAPADPVLDSPELTSLVTGLDRESKRSCTCRPSTVTASSALSVSTAHVMAPMFPSTSSAVTSMSVALAARAA